MKKGNPIRWLFALGLLAALATALYAGFTLAFRDFDVEEEQYRTYDYHIALISGNTDSGFWQKVYESLVETGEDYGIYVEQTGTGLFGRPSLEDAMNMAIFQDVDGILLRPGEEETMQDLINKACSRGIPVITMQKDVPHSSRQGFVGANDYWLGQAYGKRVKKIADRKTKLVTVLFPGATFNASSRTWFRQGILDVLQDTGIQLDLRVAMDEGGINNAEDVLQEMMLQEHQYPDIIICLDEVLTQSAVQMLQQLTGPKQIRIIGSSAGQRILDAIDQGLVDSTITIDPEVLGRESMKAMVTYLRYHMVSYHTEVATRLIDGTTGGSQ